MDCRFASYAHALKLKKKIMTFTRFETLDALIVFKQNFLIQSFFFNLSNSKIYCFIQQFLEFCVIRAWPRFLYHIHINNLENK